MVGSGQKEKDFPAKGTWGNAGKALIRAPGLFQVDSAIARSVKIAERSTVQFRMEAFNVFNVWNSAAPL